MPELPSSGRSRADVVHQLRSTRPWAKAIKAAVLGKKMPPWPADPRYGHFLNDRTLSQDEISTLVAWVDSGAPAGDIHDQPPPIQWPAGWSIQPDVTRIAPSTDFIAGQGRSRINGNHASQRVRQGHVGDVDRDSPDESFGCPSRSSSIVPHDKKVKYGVPHFTIQPRDAEGVATKRIHKNDRLRTLVELDAVYVPGVPAVDFSLHHAAKLIPAGSDLVLQMHYTTNGTATTDQTEIGFTLAKEVPARQFITVAPAALRENRIFTFPPATRIGRLTLKSCFVRTPRSCGSCRTCIFAERT